MNQITITCSKIGLSHWFIKYQVLSFAKLEMDIIKVPASKFLSSYKRHYKKRQASRVSYQLQSKHKFAISRDATPCKIETSTTTTSVLCFYSSLTIEHISFKPWVLFWNSFNDFDSDDNTHSVGIILKFYSGKTLFTHSVLSHGLFI